MEKNKSITELLEVREKELNTQFEKEKNEAEIIEEQVKALQAKHHEKLTNMIRLQGAFALLQELKEEGKTEKAETVVPPIPGSPDRV